MSHTFDAFIGRAVLATTFVFGLVCSTRAIAETVVAPPVALPSAIQISAELRPLVERMAQASQTFRRQYERIFTTPHLVVNLRVSSMLLDLTVRARTVIRRYDSGLLVAMIEVGPGVGEHEWIAHEFEHVLEQVEGLRLAELAGRSSRGTWYSGKGMIETRRAVGAGRTVVGEMRKHQRQSDKYVE